MASLPHLKGCEHACCNTYAVGFLACLVGIKGVKVFEGLCCQLQERDCSGLVENARRKPEASEPPEHFAFLGSLF